MQIRDRVRHATLLAHSIEGVSLRLSAITGVELVVSYQCLNAELTPCQLRNLLLTPTAEHEFVRCVSSVDVDRGLVHLGGGIYQPTAPGTSRQRWFASGLHPDDIAARLSDEGDGAIADDQFGVTLRADPELDLVAVGVSSLHPCVDQLVDEVATRALSACLVAELIAETTTSRSNSQQ